VSVSRFILSHDICAAFLDSLITVPGIFLRDVVCVKHRIMLVLHFERVNENCKMFLYLINKIFFFCCFVTKFIEPSRETRTILFLSRPINSILNLNSFNINRYFLLVSKHLYFFVARFKNNIEFQISKRPLQFNYTAPNWTIEIYLNFVYKYIYTLKVFARYISLFIMQVYHYNLVANHIMYPRHMIRIYFIPTR
jgi:hypothetical protein